MKFICEKNHENYFVKVLLGKQKKKGQEGKKGKENLQCYSVSKITKQNI